MPTLNIPLTTLRVGATVFGPVTQNSAVSEITLDLDRTAGNSSLNSLPSSEQLAGQIDYSTDNGATWINAFGFVTVGGTFFDDDGVTVLTRTTVTQQRGIPGGAQVRATVTVTGARVTVQGSLATA